MAKRDPEAIRTALTGLLKFYAPIPDARLDDIASGKVKGGEVHKEEAEAVIQARKAVKS